ncbi:MAG: hypothetical protein V1777_00160 [Candidatus Micrarchaeota archaeon]
MFRGKSGKSPQELLEVRDRLQRALEQTGKSLDVRAFNAFVAFAFIHHQDWSFEFALRQAIALRDQRRENSLLTLEELSQKLRLSQIATLELAQIIKKNPVNPKNIFGLEYYDARQYRTLFSRLNDKRLGKWILWRDAKALRAAIESHRQTELQRKRRAAVTARVAVASQKLDEIRRKKWGADALHRRGLKSQSPIWH